MKEAFELLRKNGYKITPQRQEILNTIIDTDNKTPLRAEDIYRKVIKRYPNVSVDTIYRNLIILLDLGIIKEINFRDSKSQYYELNLADHHHYLICLGCGVTQSIDCPLKSVDEEKIAEEKNFEIKKHNLELYGYCVLCREKTEDKS
ncbi:ferric uptake regulator, Fur family [Desulfofarcimen acetoxidans DSM 771]|jgi:Fur family zinc uptake transcriptional regulator/Fur family ferric uptake transcriptional regulator|uniref:Ferric uptake regulator, Fur family n=1 Tax=Desulfofarcimen acetoxidans (strain ATCC 49208 / DSM 771 / KCTC 5769 / VKM B-1644 / 5575) TaxID=485916 RepID=C8W431_DESAS|nr:Fur family transcriptional regulator [Desulfofarcimen acetoxidans]ACV61285.1 ferric uptake regulator, Fur family [Desulfofarcimen acetoxidans DSM 771]